MKRIALILALIAVTLPQVACIENNIVGPAESSSPADIAASRVSFPAINGNQQINLAVSYKWQTASFFLAPKEWKPGVVLSSVTKDLQIVPYVIPVNGAIPDQDGNRPYFLMVEMTSFAAGLGRFCLHPAGNSSAEVCADTNSGFKG